MEYKNTTYVEHNWEEKESLNPCSNGIQKYYQNEEQLKEFQVLILVLMEYKNTVCKSIS